MQSLSITINLPNELMVLLVSFHSIPIRFVDSSNRPISCWNYWTWLFGLLFDLGLSFGYCVQVIVLETNFELSNNSNWFCLFYFTQFHRFEPQWCKISVVILAYFIIWLLNYSPSEPKFKGEINSKFLKFKITWEKYRTEMKTISNSVYYCLLNLKKRASSYSYSIS